MRHYFLFFFFVLLGSSSIAQHYQGRIIDSLSGEGLPFATIKYGGTNQGSVTDLNGRFRIDTTEPIPFFEISHVGYRNKKVTLHRHADSLIIRLSTSDRELGELVFTPPYEKIRRIINAAITNRAQNNPEQYDWYKCHVYHKMVFDMKLPDSLIGEKIADTNKSKMMDFLNDQHLLMSETYSVRRWRKPQQLQEVVIGTRLSGFKKSIATILVTDILPFHAYSDYIKLNEKDYHNPISEGYNTRYEFNLNDEILQGNDTIWVLSFRPKTRNKSELRGTVYIHSNGYAIAYFLAQAWDEYLNRSIRIEQQYNRIDQKWFPQELNYIFDFQQMLEKDSNKKPIYYNLVMKGNSKIDSVSFEDDRAYRFDKSHTVKLQKKAYERSDIEWDQIRPVELEAKDERTYKVVDSIMENWKFGRLLSQNIEKLVEGKLPMKFLDIDLKRIYGYNRFESSRLGLGLQTNEKISSRLSFGGWFGYGFGDKAWKYGGFAELYVDQYREFVFRFSYDHDLRDPGRLQLHKDVDKNYLRMFLMSRVDRIESLNGSVNKRLGYWDMELAVRTERIQPLYDYSLQPGGVDANRFKADEAALSIRYAYAERRAPLFSKYYNTPTKYPIAYSKLTLGQLEENYSSRYFQAVLGVNWQKHINRIGNERLLITGGKIWSNQPLPISKLFAGNGFRYDKSALYSFGGMLTIYPYEFYSDQFINAYWKHDFDWHVYNTEYSAPSLSVAHNVLWGTLDARAVHKEVLFSTPDQAYHESGLLLNNLVRIKYFDVFYFTLNGGYFYHCTDKLNPDKNGRFVFGVGAEF